MERPCKVLFVICVIKMVQVEEGALKISGSIRVSTALIAWRRTINKLGHRYPKSHKSMINIWNSKNLEWGKSSIKFKVNQIEILHRLLSLLVWQKKNPSLAFTHIRKMNKRIEERIFWKGLMFGNKLIYTVLTIIVFGNLVFWGGGNVKTKVYVKQFIVKERIKLSTKWMVNM